MCEYNEKTPLLATEADQLSLAGEYTCTADHQSEVDHLHPTKEEETKEEDTVHVPSKILWESWIMISLTSIVNYTRPPEFDEEGRKYNWSIWWYARGIKHYKRTRKEHKRGGWKWVKTERGKILDSEYIWPNGRNA